MVLNIHKIINEKIFFIIEKIILYICIIIITFASIIFLYEKKIVYSQSLIKLYILQIT